MHSLFPLLSSLHLLPLGEVYTWGDNDEGQLGDGTTNAIQRPRLVAALQGKKVNRVACGSAHTLAWSTSKPASAGKLPAQVSAIWIAVPKGSTLTVSHHAGPTTRLIPEFCICRGVHYNSQFLMPQNNDINNCNVGLVA